RPRHHHRHLRRRQRCRRAAWERAVNEETGQVYERAVIGAGLASPWQAVQLRGRLNAEDFTDPWHREIHRLPVDPGPYRHPLIADKSPADKPVVLAQMLYAALRREAHAHAWPVTEHDWAKLWPYLLDLPRQAPSPAHATAYAGIVAERSWERTVGA